MMIIISKPQNSSNLYNMKTQTMGKIVIRHKEQKNVAADILIQLKNIGQYFSSQDQYPQLVLHQCY